MRLHPVPAGVVAILLGAGIAQAAQVPPSWEAAKKVDVVLSDFDYSPKALQLQQGQAYRLHFVNQGSGGHNFSAPDFFASARLDPADAAAITKGKIEVPEGESRDVRLVPAAGSYKVRCAHFMHSAFGMKGSITVN